jgi:hypothetical protein
VAKNLCNDRTGVPGLFCELEEGSVPRCALPGKTVVELEVAIDSGE